MAVEHIQLMETQLTRSFGISHPIVLAGMNQAAGPELAAAVSNGGGLGVIGGVGCTPSFLRTMIQEIKENLRPVKHNGREMIPPFGVDLLLPQVGGNARKTNFDYTQGKLGDLIDIIIEEGAKLFVCAVGVPPKWAVDKLHEHKIFVMNMIGSPNHVKKALDQGVDILCAQGSEGGGHTGDVNTSVLIPAVKDLVKGRVSPMTGDPIMVIAAGGIYDGRGLAMSLCLGAEGVWVGTRFLASVEGGAPKVHKKAVIDASVHDTMRTLLFTGRPLRILKSPYAMNWEEFRRDEMKALLEKGVLPYMVDLQELKGGLAQNSEKENGEKIDSKEKKDIETSQDGDIPQGVRTVFRPFLMGQVAGNIHDIKPAQVIIDEMVQDAARLVRDLSGTVLTRAVSKL